MPRHHSHKPAGSPENKCAPQAGRVRNPLSGRMVSRSSSVGRVISHFEERCRHRSKDCGVLPFLSEQPPSSEQGSGREPKKLNPCSRRMVKVSTHVGRLIDYYRRWCNIHRPVPKKPRQPPVETCFPELAKVLYMNRSTREKLQELYNKGLYVEYGFRTWDTNQPPSHSPSAANLRLYYRSAHKGNPQDFLGRPRVLLNDVLQVAAELADRFLAGERTAIPVFYSDAHVIHRDLAAALPRLRLTRSHWEKLHDIYASNLMVRCTGLREATTDVTVSERTPKRPKWRTKSRVPFGAVVRVAQELAESLLDDIAAEKRRRGRKKDTDGEDGEEREEEEEEDEEEEDQMEEDEGDEGDEGDEEDEEEDDQMEEDEGDEGDEEDEEDEEE